jgi:predicted PurR-regulated permease PerM
LVYYTKDILSILFISLIIVATLSPIADFLTKYLRWRVISVLLIYLVTLILLSGLIAALVPALSSQTQEFVTNLPQYTDQIPVLKDFGQVIKEEFIGESLSINSLTEYITQSSLKIFQFTGSLIGIIGSLLVIIVISFYGLLSEKNIREELKKYLNKNNLKSYWLISDKIYSKLGIWLRSQILLAIIVGLITGVALYLLSVPYALLLGVLAGVLEIIPVLGPVIASIPAIIIGLTVSPFIGLIVVALYILIHQIESYVLVPKVMEKALGLSPVLILSALLIGAKLGGIVGAIIAVPLASAITILVLEIPKINESSSQK